MMNLYQLGFVDLQNNQQQYQADVCKIRLDKSSTYGELVVYDTSNVPTDTKHVFLNCLKTSTAIDKFLKEISREDGKFRNLHDGDCIVRYLPNLNTEDISFSNMLCSFVKECMAQLMLLVANKLSYLSQCALSLKHIRIPVAGLACSSRRTSSRLNVFFPSVL